MKTATTPQVAVSLQALTGAQFSGGVAEVSSTTIPLVQVLRAVAALLVLLGHMGWGLPAAAVLATAVLLEPSGRSTPRSLSPLVTLGDWSYALYLTHTFALIVVVNAWKLLELQSVFGALALAVVQVAAAVIVAGLVYRWFELPVTTALRRRFC